MKDFTSFDIPQLKKRKSFQRFSLFDKEDRMKNKEKYAIDQRFIALVKMKEDCKFLELIFHN